ncbi:HAD family phosphatase [Porphyromonadaceae sp. NP-X]|jgi:putative hydrolase of the HAD superfamily|nr:HAD family phosphatase [Porphyromonadaceae sp. NP-X]NLJ21409.1 HAD family phosphatase [Bacteroidales bacterium]
MIHFKNISALIFDFGGVLINLSRQRCIDSFRALGVRELEKYLDDFNQSGFFLELEQGKISPEQFRNEVRKLTDQTLTDEQIDQAFCSFLLDIPEEKLKLLLDIRKRFKIYLLSNTNLIHMNFCRAQHFHFNGYSMDDFFDKCYLSYELGLTKPDIRVFNAVIDDIGLAPQQCLFLDDGLKNIEQAQKTGLQTYWVKQEEDLSFLLQPEVFVYD